MGTILVIGDGCLSRNSRTEWLSEGPVVAVTELLMPHGRLA
jgi:hypothetical protein